MIIFDIESPPRMFGFKHHPAMNDFKLSRCQTPEEFSGPDFEGLEELQDINGEMFDRAPLTANVGGLLITEDLAPKLRDYLNEHGCIVAERRIITPLDSYVVFRVFNHYNDNPNAPMFRLWRSSKNKTLSISQYANPEFISWLKANFDTRGLKFRSIQREEAYESIFGETSSTSNS